MGYDIGQIVGVALARTDQVISTDDQSDARPGLPVLSNVFALWIRVGSCAWRDKR